MWQHVAPDQDLHCLLSGISMQNTVEVKLFTRISKTTDRLIQMKRMDKSNGWSTRPVRVMDSSPDSAFPIT